MLVTDVASFTANHDLRFGNQWGGRREGSASPSCGGAKSTLGETHSVTLRVIGWPDDGRPGVNTDSQAEITHQFGDAFDIYVGILGTRFGTPTPRAGSGTEEEFENALNRFRKNSTTVRVLFYFKRTSEDAFAIDITQLSKVQEFRERLPARGVIYRDFGDTAAFTTLVQDHLYNLIVDEWRNDCWSAVALPSSAGIAARPSSPVEAAEGVSLSKASTSPTGVEDDEPGFLDYVVAFHESAAAFVDVVGRMGQDIQTIGEKVRIRATEMDRLRDNHDKVQNVGGSRAEQEFASRARDSADAAAHDLDEFVNALSATIEPYKLHSRAMLSNLRSGLEFSDFSTGKKQENVDALEKMIGASETSRDQLGTFQASVTRLAPLTGKVKRARRRTAAALGELIAELALFIEEAKRLLDHYRGGAALSQ
jgi:hypothetical protein